MPRIKYPTGKHSYFPLDIDKLYPWDKLRCMQFKTWAELERGRAMAVARATGMPASLVSKIVSGDKAMPAQHCKTVVQLSGGLVTCQEMRPDDWHKYWPEFAQSTAPALADCAQGATETVASGMDQ